MLIIAEGPGCKNLFKWIFSVENSEYKKCVYIFIASYCLNPTDKTLFWNAYLTQMFYYK